ncbi:MAG TPA: aminotransferase class IV [Thermohalobaculum sp.]|nr:aminotransferase class IV [Thermohalobaculum sp.]
MTDWSEGAAWIGGRVVPIAEASIGVTDWGLVHCDITYDVAPVWDGGFFRLSDYLDRLQASMAALRLDIGMTRGAIREALHAIVARSGLRAAYVAMVASRGVPLVPGTRDPRRCANHFYAWCVPYIRVIGSEAEASAWIAREVRRIPADSIDPRVKNYHWGDFTRGLMEAKDRGYETVILTDHAGNIAEGPGFNVFSVREGRVVTPASGCLEGVTRRTVLEICAEQGIATEVRTLPVAELMAADEVFISSTAGGPVALTRVDERVFANGAPGPVTSLLRDRYLAWLRRPELRDAVDYGAA